MDPDIVFELFRAKAPLARAAIDHRIGEVVEMAARFPDFRMRENRRVEPDHVGTVLHRVAPPGALDVILQFHAERSVVPARPRSAVKSRSTEK